MCGALEWAASEGTMSPQMAENPQVQSEEHRGHVTRLAMDWSRFSARLLLTSARKTR